MTCVHFLPHRSDYVTTVTSGVTTLSLIIVRDSTVQTEVQTHVYLFFIFQEMCSLSLRINAHMKHAYKMFYNVIDYGITDW